MPSAVLEPVIPKSDTKLTNRVCCKIQNIVLLNQSAPIPMAESSKARIYASSLVGIVGWDPAWGMDVSLLGVLCVCHVQIYMTNRFLVQWRPSDCGVILSVT